MARKSRKNLEASIEVSPEILTFNTALYIRLSVEDNKKRGNSVETQRSILENYIALMPEISVYDVYIDNGTTGTNFERPEFKRMMNDVDCGKVNCVIVKDLSRLGRNAIDTGFYIEKYFPLNKVRFISVNDIFDTNNNENHYGGIILPLKNMINEAYSLDIGKKIRTQAHQSMKAGDFIGARPPYGYSKAADNCHKLIVDEKTAPIVRQIFTWAFQQVGINDIVKRLNQANILPPSQYAQSRGLITHENLLGNGKWQTRTIQKILSDEVYIGDMVQGKTKSVNHKQMRVEDKTQWIVVKDTHEPIVSRELFEAVTTYRNLVATESVKREKIPFTENIFKGKIFCECCGGSLHRQRSLRKKVPHTYIFHCLTNSRIAKGSCEGVLLREDELCSVVLTILKKKAKVITGRHLILQQNNELLHVKQAETKSKIIELKQSIDVNRRFLKSLYENLVKGILTDVEYLSMKVGYETKITQALSELNSLEAEKKELEDQVAEFCDLANSIERIDDNTVLTPAMVEKLIDKIVVDSNKQIEIFFRFENEFDRIDGLVVCDADCSPMRPGVCANG